MKSLFKIIIAGAILSLSIFNVNAQTPWYLTGNAATVPGTIAAPGTNFLGTTDAQDFAFRTNNVERLRIASNGGVNIGSNYEYANISPILTVQNRVVSGHYTVGNVASFIQHNYNSTLASPSPTLRVNILDAKPVPGSGFFNCSQYKGSGNWNTYFSISTDGSTIIGDHSVVLAPGTFGSTYKLVVQGGLLTEKVKIALCTDATNWSWPDYVFKKDYTLVPLNELESFIDKNKHLPGIPSESEVKTKGLDVAEMEASLLKKIEELTLYIIEMQKQIDHLKAGKN